MIFYSLKKRIVRTTGHLSSHIDFLSASVFSPLFLQWTIPIDHQSVGRRWQLVNGWWLAVGEGPTQSYPTLQAHYNVITHT